jgi:hypothetical protein
MFKPEIEDWIKDEPENPVPYRWTYEIDLFKKIS